MATGLDINYCSKAQQSLRAEMAGSDLDWLAARRESSLTAFQAHGFPGDRDENWKYTNIRPLVRNVYEFSPASSRTEQFDPSSGACGRARQRPAERTAASILMTLFSRECLGVMDGGCDTIRMTVVDIYHGESAERRRRLCSDTVNPGASKSTFLRLSADDIIF